MSLRPLGLKGQSSIAVSLSFLVLFDNEPLFMLFKFLAVARLELRSPSGFRL